MDTEERRAGGEENDSLEEGWAPARLLMGYRPDWQPREPVYFERLREVPEIRTCAYARCAAVFEVKNPTHYFCCLECSTRARRGKKQRAS